MTDLALLAPIHSNPECIQPWDACWGEKECQSAYCELVSSPAPLLPPSCQPPANHLPITPPPLASGAKRCQPALCNPNPCVTTRHPPPATRQVYTTIATPKKEAWKEMSCTDILSWIDTNSGALNDPDQPAKPINYVGSAKALGSHNDKFCTMWSTCYLWNFEK